jgi:tRNA threonylcarbamoyladenosine modification (KEOPS) complex  Pcc1 subunit
MEFFRIVVGTEIYCLCLKQRSTAIDKIVKLKKKVWNKKSRAQLKLQATFLLLFIKAQD